MSRIVYPASLDAASEAAKPMLEGVNKMLGSVPNLFRLVSVSPAALEGYVGLFGALSKGKLEAATRERIALAVAEVNGCGYCLAAHSYLGKNLAKLSDEEMASNRKGQSGDAKATAAVMFAAKVAKDRGSVSEADLAAVRKAGYPDAQLVEIVAHVALNVLTNYINETFKTDIDFPAAAKLR